MPWETDQTVVQLTMHFNGIEAGWSERCFLVATSAKLAIPAATNLVNYRLLLLPSVLDLAWAKVSVLGAPRDRKLIPGSYPAPGAWPGVITAPATVPDPLTLYPNRDEDALEISLETEEGSFTTRYIHGIPDAYVTKEQLVSPIVIPSSVPALTTLPGSHTWYELAGYYLFVVQTTSKMFRKRLTPQGVVQYQTSPIDALYHTRTRGHKVGRFFGAPVGRARPR